MGPVDGTNRYGRDVDASDRAKSQLSVIVDSADAPDSANVT